MREVVIALLTFLGLVGGMVHPASSVEALGPTLTLSPEVGHPQLPFKAQSTGFQAGETVDLSFDDLATGKVQANSEGAFKARLRVPSLALPGDHQVTAVGEISGLSASATFLVRMDWGRFLLDGANRWNRFENVLNTGNVGQLTMIWRRDGCAGQCSVALVKGILYMADPSYPDLTSVSAFDASTGTVLWSMQFPAIVDLDPMVADDKVLLAFEDGSVVGLDANTGEIVWSVVPGGKHLGQLAADHERLYVPLYRGELVALLLVDGTTVWRAHVSPYPSGAAVWRGVVYVGGTSVTEALDAATGAAIWSTPASCRFCESITYSSGLVFTGSIDGDVFAALDASTGQKVWSVRPEHAYGMETAPAAADGVLFLPTSDLGWFYALDARTGEVLWSRAYESYLWASSPAVANGVVYIGNDNGSVVAVDAATGATLWEEDFDYAPFGPPIVADGRVYVTGGGFLWAFGLPDG